MKTINLTLFVLVLLLSMGCENPADPAPTSGTISGTVTFAGTWPTTGTVSISMQTAWPPTLAPYAFKTIESTDLNSDVYSYSFENVAFGVYPATAISWQDPNDLNSATNQHILGAYGATASDFNDATSITVSAGSHEQNNLNFTADLSLINETVPNTSGTISGEVTFTGTWPTTGTVSISMQTSWPPTTSPYAFKTIELINLNSDVYSYSFVTVVFGTYPAIVISWQDPNDSNPATNQHTLGAYGGVYPFFTVYGGADPTAVTVSEDSHEQNNLNFIADLIYATGSEQ